MWYLLIPTAPCYATKLNRDERTENETMLHVWVPNVYWSLLSAYEVRSGLGKLVRRPETERGARSMIWKVAWWYSELRNYNSGVSAVRISDRPKVEPVCSTLLGHFPSTSNISWGGFISLSVPPAQWSPPRTATHWVGWDTREARWSVPPSQAW